MQKITPCLWFRESKKAEEAAKFYTSIFPKSKIVAKSYYDKKSAKACGMPAGAVSTISFKIHGQDFIILNGGPAFQLNEAISFYVNCKTQKELDSYWSKLLKGGGKEVACGWLKDKFGLAWQIVPEKVFKMLQDKDEAKVSRFMAAMMQMVKLDLKKLEEAYKG